MPLSENVESDINKFNKLEDLKEGAFFFLCDLEDAVNKDNISHIGLIIKHNSKFYLFDYLGKKVSFKEISISDFNNKGLAKIKILDKKFEPLIEAIHNQFERFIKNIDHYAVKILHRIEFDDSIINLSDIIESDRKDISINLTCSTFIVYAVKSIVNMLFDNEIIFYETWGPKPTSSSTSMDNRRISPLHCLTISIPSDLSDLPLKYDFCSSQYFELPSSN